MLDGIYRRFTRRAGRFTWEQRCNLLALRSYFDGSLASRQDIDWLFILTFPNGGSTAFAKLLLTAVEACALTDNAEGQWLVPELCKDIARWDPGHQVSYRKVRAVWLKTAARRSAPITGRPLVIEKSPPNLCRYEQLLRAFGSMNVYLLTLSRNPYATCASWHSRYGFTGIGLKWAPDIASVQTEEEYFAFLGGIWLARAKMLVEARKSAVLNVRYEDLVEDPAAVLQQLAGRIAQMRTASLHTNVKVKDYEEQPIQDMNARQIKRLSASHISAISSALALDPSIVHELGYEIL